MHKMWDKESLLILFASDAGGALLRQVNDAVEKRGERAKALLPSKVLVSMLDANGLGLALGREKVSVVAFLRSNPVEKFQQLCVWQQALAKVTSGLNKREAR